ncbi:MAG: Uma2 family endonuclease [Chloroflexota bacterium]
MTQGLLLIVEIISKNDQGREAQKRIEEYFAIGTSMVWIVNWETQETTVYLDPSTSAIYRRHDTLKNLAVPEFKGMAIELDKIFQGL